MGSLKVLMVVRNGAEKSKHEGVIHFCNQCAYEAARLDTLERYKQTKHLQVEHEGAVYLCLSIKQLNLALNL